MKYTGNCDFFLNVFYILCNLNIIEASNLVYNYKVFHWNEVTTYHGTLQNISGAISLHECSSICLKEPTCEAVLFNEMNAIRTKCYIIKYVVDAIDIRSMDGYSYFTKGQCMGIPIPETWESRCPQLYLNMENIHGGLVLGSMSNPQFVSGGQIGLMFHHNGTESSDMGFGFGWYTGTEHCFTQPKYCNEGVSYAMWVTLLGDSGNTLENHIFGTGGELKSGFAVGWDTNSLWAIATNNDTGDGVFFPPSNFMSDYGYNNWVHCVFVYKYGAATPGSSDIKMYLNGMEQNVTRMSNPPLPSQPTIRYLVIGNSYVRMNIDEFLVWQKILSTEDIKKLYDAYQ